MRPSVIAHAVRPVILTWRVGPVGSSLESQYRGTLRPAKQNTTSRPVGAVPTNPMNTNQPQCVCQPTP